VGGRTASVRVIAAAEAAALGYGTVVHVVQLVMGGCRPYPWAPTWLAAFFASLTVLDPVAAALLWRRRTAGPYLAAFVFVTDAAANGYADSCVSPDVPATAPPPMRSSRSWRLPYWPPFRSSVRGCGPAVGRRSEIRQCDSAGRRQRPEPW
jgi:hypothetical protein